jgi:hypothetical protein
MREHRSASENDFADADKGRPFNQSLLAVTIDERIKRWILEEIRPGEVGSSSSNPTWAPAVRAS